MAFPTLAEIAAGKAVIGPSGFGQKTVDSLQELNSKISGGMLLPPNGSFEIDSNEDGIPDNWTRSLYPGGSSAFETTAPAHGAQAYKFVHPGGAGNGGGYLESNYIGIAEQYAYMLYWILWASAAGMKNIVTVRYYDKAQSYISDEDLYNSTSNPTSATGFGALFQPPATARYIKIRLIGGYTDTDVAGDIFFDAVTLEELGAAVPGDTIEAISHVSAVATATDYTKRMEITIVRPGEYRVLFRLYAIDGTGTAYGRICRNGNLVGTERSTSSSSWVTFSEDIDGWSAGDLCQLQVKKLYGGRAGWSFLTIKTDDPVRAGSTDTPNT
jgi:hypothetical protein